MSFQTTETIQRFFSQFIREALADLPPEQRKEYEPLLERRLAELAKNAANGGAAADFASLVGLGDKGALPFDSLTFPRLESDFDEAVIPTQLHSCAELYYIYQHERMKVFQVAGVLLRLFHDGRMRIQRGPGARALYLIEKHFPLRYKARDRALAYRRAFGYGAFAPPGGAIVFNNFHRQFVALNAAIAQYYRDLLIGEVIRGSQLIDQRPFGSQATIQRIGQDIRWELDRSTYGFIVSLAVETGNFLKSILDMLETPDILKAWDANTKWDVIEFVSQRHLGGIGQLTQRSKMADAGRRILQFVADDPMKERDFQLFQTIVQPLGTVSEEWIAAYRMTPEGRGFPGVTPALRQMLGLPSARAA
jgi:hypothetical protein